MASPTLENTSAPMKRIVLCGSGLAAQMTAAAMALQLPPEIEITWLRAEGTEHADFLYGNVAPPSAYDFNLSAGLSEPSLITASNTSFSFGTEYAGWSRTRESWVQAYHEPLPVLEGVPFQHYLTQQGIFELEPYLVSAVAARAGAFAHPPEEADHPLSRAEYGYHFEAAAYGALFEKAVQPGRLAITAGVISAVDHEAGEIMALRLADGQTLEADLFIDCTGPEARLLSRLHADHVGGRRIAATASLKRSTGKGGVVRQVTAHDFGWVAHTPLRADTAVLTVFDPETAEPPHDDAPAVRAEVTLGQHAAAWVGNCVALGHAAGVIEPVTVAPVLLLQRDIERLLALLPNSRQMSVERREFNRQYADDYRHAGLFNRALFESSAFPVESYWRAAREAPLDDRLVNKIEQFESRGLHVAFDLEPFTPEDWLILHYGMGRRPGRYDRFVDNSPAAGIRQYLATLQQNIQRCVSSMPGHEDYIQGLTRFLAQQRTSRA